jgi:hypothetical protein
MVFSGNNIGGGSGNYINLNFCSAVCEQQIKHMQNEIIKRDELILTLISILKKQKISNRQLKLIIKTIQN